MRSRPGVRVLPHGPVIGVERRLHKQNGGDAAGDVGHLSRLVDMKRPAQNLAFAIRQPLLDDLVAADGVSPHMVLTLGAVATPVAFQPRSKRRVRIFDVPISISAYRTTRDETGGS